jgi:hypothetical protein
MKRIGMLVIVMAFFSGWAVASTAFATHINAGLVAAFSSVGQNLFGDAAFAAVVVPPNPVQPQGGVQLDVALDTQIATNIGVFVPPNPTAPTDLCRRFAQMEVQDGNVVLSVDPDAMPHGFNTTVQFKSLAALAPAVNRCSVGNPGGDDVPLP